MEDSEFASFATTRKYLSQATILHRRTRFLRRYKYEYVIATRGSNYSEQIVKRLPLLKRLYLRHLAKPVAERVLFSVIATQPVRQIVEIGIGDCSRALRLISLAAKCLGGPVAYCGIDLFEAAPRGKTILKYKDAYCKLNIENCKTKLVPGEPAMALATCANSLTNTNLIVVSNQFDSAALAPMWMYVPRMLAADAKIFMQSDDGNYHSLSLRDLMSLADQATEMRRKSA